jgi:hypothetical protein
MTPSSILISSAQAAVAQGLTQFEFGNHNMVYHVFKESEATNVKPVMALFGFELHGVRYVCWY